VLTRLTYLGVVNVFAVLRLLPGTDRDKNTEILALRHQLAVVRCRLGGQKIRFQPADQTLPALLQHLPRSRPRDPGSGRRGP
jgi:putative transposase